MFEELEGKKVQVVMLEPSESRKSGWLEYFYTATVQKIKGSVMCLSDVRTRTKRVDSSCTNSLQRSGL